MVNFYLLRGLVTGILNGDSLLFESDSYLEKPQLEILPPFWQINLYIICNLRKLQFFRLPSVKPVLLLNVSSQLVLRE